MAQIASAEIANRSDRLRTSVRGARDNQMPKNRKLNHSKRNMVKVTPRESDHLKGVKRTTIGMHVAANPSPRIAQGLHAKKAAPAGATFVFVRAVRPAPTYLMRGSVLNW